MNELVIGCVGKPSAGKSSFLNAATDANAKVGNYPFTTIEPNIGVTYYTTECPCVKYGKTDHCAPRYGKCVKGTRYIPVKILDVAGLVPGAHEGKGLGNKFLDDLRKADVFLHVIDASGTTNEKGENTVGYDPTNDVAWLRFEIHSWIFNNLWKKWSGIVRRHTATKSTAANTFQLQFSGYGTKIGVVMQTLDKMGVHEPCDLELWDEAKVHSLVDALMEVRFPTILALNKIDKSAADQNIAKICKKYPDQPISLTSALGETFLRKMRAQGFIRYVDGADNFDTLEDLDPSDPDRSKLKKLDDATKDKLEKIRDLVLFRYGSTGIAQTIKMAVELRGYIPVYTVKNVTTFSNDKGHGCFRDCFLVPPGTKVRELAGMIHPDLDKYFLYAEGPSGLRLAEDEVITQDNNIIKFTTATAVSSSDAKSS